MESKSSFSRSSEMTYKYKISESTMSRDFMFGNNGINLCQPTSSAFLGDTCSMINLMTVGRSLRSADSTQPRATSRIYTQERSS